MEKLIQFIKGIFNSVYYNFPFIFLSVAFPLLFYKLDAGRELILLLAEPNQLYNLGLVTFSFQLLSLCLWCLPILAIELFSTMTHSFKSDQSKHKLALHLKLLYSNRGDKNYVASEDWAYLPWIIFNYSLIATYWNKAYVEFWLFPLIIGIYISLKYLFKNKIQHIKSRKFSSNKFLIYLIKHKILTYSLFLLLHSIPVLLYFIQFHDQNQEINESSPRLSLFVILFSNSLMILHILYLYFNRIYERISIQNSLNQLEPGREFNKASVDQLFTERIDSVQI